ncbi:hypothetical protein JCGZ_10358 [Jatropha curcas]|uniref:Uncharacterized protein n=1 Tax=Jatropha curcas TaxID=180498 RepID=A0A067KU43_JATCU|nr:hypothetical protein JCGZ_10358 [Jatropha curcas]
MYKDSTEIELKIGDVVQPLAFIFPEGHRARNASGKGNANGNEGDNMHQNQSGGNGTTQKKYTYRLLYGTKSWVRIAMRVMEGLNLKGEEVGEVVVVGQILVGEAEVEAVGLLEVGEVGEAGELVFQGEIVEVLKQNDTDSSNVEYIFIGSTRRSEVVKGKQLVIGESKQHTRYSFRATPATPAETLLNKDFGENDTYSSNVEYIFIGSESNDDDLLDRIELELETGIEAKRNNNDTPGINGDDVKMETLIDDEIIEDKDDGLSSLGSNQKEKK